MNDESYIQIALELAKKGKGNVSPQALVGALVVKNNKIIGAAYRSSSIDEGPEIGAIKNSKEPVENSTLYTNLEPCIFNDNDSENTPLQENCVDFIIESKIKRVIIGSANPHPEFGGKAIKKFNKAGIDVKIGVYEKECFEVNKFYFNYCASKRPYVTLKMAATLDGKIADVKGNSKWITSVESRSLVHELRSEYDAVLVGIKTVQADNPNLTVRLVEGRNPYRIVLDRNLELSTNSNLVKNNYDKKLIVLTSKKNKSKEKKLKKLYDKDVEVIFVNEKKNGGIDLSAALKKLGNRNIISLLVEGGGKLFTGFVKEKLENEILIFIGPKILGGGISLANGLSLKSIGKAFNYTLKDLDKIGEDALLRLVRR